ncbi:uncharacterized protein DS421_20g684060 [Arachis hypogaea]|nr:uncharacterized protein DS421_20g684060 [Arachis hypogaea]
MFGDLSAKAAHMISLTKNNLLFASSTYVTSEESVETMAKEEKKGMQGNLRVSLTSQL